MATLVNTSATALDSTATAAAINAKSFNNQKRNPLGNVTNNVHNMQAKKAKVQTAGAVTAPAAGMVLRSTSTQPMETTSDDVEQQQQQVAVAPISTAVATLPAGVEDIDEGDVMNTQMATDYVVDIYKYMRELEAKLAVPENYLDSQQDINAKMRTILVDWLVEVHHRFDLMQETLYLTVHLVDRYLSIKQTSRNQLQLVGVTAMLIASKYEDMYPPEVADFVYISDNAFAASDILAMERQMLKTLDFALGKPLPLHFLRRNSRAGHADVTMHTIAKYLTELTLCSSKMLKYFPSEIAAAACYISREVVNEPEVWNATIQHYADYTLEDIQPCIEDMKEMLAKSVTCKQQATRNKYADPKYLRIAKLPELETFIASL